MKGECIATPHLASSDKEQMFALLQKNFLGVRREVFEADLGEKNRVILFRDAGVLRGFSTFLYYTTDYNNEKLGIVYSGDTIIDPSAWGSLQLPKSWIKAVRDTGQQYDTARQFWLLLVSGFRTYRFLPVFWKQFYPRYDQHTPQHMQDLLNHLAGERFGALFDPERGIVVFPQPQILRHFLAKLPSSRLSNPHVRFFEHINPGWKRGNELVCLTELCDDNLSPAGKRIVFEEVRTK